MKIEHTMLILGALMAVIIVGSFNYFAYKHLITLVTKPAVVVTKTIMVGPAPTASPSAKIILKVSPKVINAK